MPKQLRRAASDGGVESAQAPWRQSRFASTASGSPVAQVAHASRTDEGDVLCLNRTLAFLSAMPSLLLQSLQLWHHESVCHCIQAPPQQLHIAAFDGSFESTQAPWRQSRFARSCPPQGCTTPAAHAAHASRTAANGRGVLRQDAGIPVWNAESAPRVCSHSIMEVFRACKQSVCHCIQAPPKQLRKGGVESAQTPWTQSRLASTSQPQGHTTPVAQPAHASGTAADGRAVLRQDAGTPVCTAESASIL